MAHIRKATEADLQPLMKIYDYARNLMQTNGNTTQWINGYPSINLIREDIAKGNSYVCENEHGDILGTFCFITGEDPTYATIYNGKWLNDEPYSVVHRLATNGREKGVAAACLDWCSNHCKNLRIDTHHDNILMQNILKKQDFMQCGIIHVKDGSERLAFQKIHARPL